MNYFYFALGCFWVGVVYYNMYDKTTQKVNWKALFSSGKMIAALLLGIGVIIMSIVNPSQKTTSSDELSRYENGVGTIKHFTGNDWDKNAMYKSMGEKVWAFSRAHSDAKKLNFIIVDECKDLKGNLSKYETTIEFEANDIKEYASYVDANSFNQNCYGYGFKMLKWKPCGNSPM